MEQRIEIIIHGHLTPAWAETFEGMRLIPQPDGSTRISGKVADQAALYGLLMRLRDLGLRLISVNTSWPHNSSSGSG
jgi:hypothetical protein